MGASKFVAYVALGVMIVFTMMLCLALSSAHARTTNGNAKCESSTRFQ